jgi:phage terminase large subunit
MSSISSILDFTDKPQQRAFFFDRVNKCIGAGGGFNSGKSYAMLAKIHLNLEVYAGSMAIIGRKTYTALEKSIIPSFEAIALRRNGGSWNGPVISKFADMTVSYANGSKLWFVTFDDVRKVRGPNVAFVGISQAEEVAHEFFLELKGRCRQWNPQSIAEYKQRYGAQLMRSLGYIPTPYNQLICEMNPAPNWVKQEFIYNKAGTNKFYDIPTTENKKYHADGWMDDLKRSYSTELYNRYINGSWDTFGGMVYPEFDIENVHGISALTIPDHWPRIVGWDHGYRNPTAIEFGAVDEMGNIVFYREHYRDHMTVKEHAEAFKFLAGSDKLPVGNNEKFLVYLDYAVKGNYDGDGKTIWDQYNELGIFGLNPDKDVQFGINMVKEYLTPDPERPFPNWHPKRGEKGSPKLFIVRPQCINLINELQTYQWEEMREGAERNAREAPRKFNDHAADAIRYAVVAIGKQMAPWIVAAQTPEDHGAERERYLAKTAFEHSAPRNGDYFAEEYY